MKLIGLSKERPMVIDRLNLTLSQISLLMHIYRFVDFDGFVDLWTWRILGFNYGF